MTKSRSEAVTVRALTPEDAPALTALYDELTFGPKTARAEDITRVLAHPGTRIFGALNAGRPLAMVTLHLLPNVTFGGRPYALVENVVTTAAWRGRGLGRAVLQAAIDAAWAAEAYKIMLLTGRKRGAQGFYEALGFSAEDKSGLVLRRD